MYKKNWLPLLVTIILLILLMGCQQVLDQFPLFQPTHAAETIATDTPENTPVFTTATDEPDIPVDNTITLWLPPEFDPTSGTDAANILSARLKKYQEENPGVSVEVRIKAANGVGGLYDTLETASSAAPGILPDVILLPYADFEKAAAAKLIQPVELSTLPIETSSWFDFAHALVDYENRDFGLPFAGDFLVLAYKRTMIVYPPAYWQEILEKDSTVLFPASDPAGLFGYLLYLNAGGRIDNYENQTILNESALLRGLTILHEGALKNVFPYWLTDQKTYDESWLSYKNYPAPYTVNWLSLFFTDQVEDTSFTMVPMVSGESITLARGWVLAFPHPAKGTNEHIFQFAAELLDPLFQQEWSEAVGLIPADRSALEGWKDSEASGILVQMAESAQTLPELSVFEPVANQFADVIPDLVRKQTSYIEAVNSILRQLSETP